VAPDSYIDEIVSISDTENDTRNTRILHWRVSWAMFMDNPILGVGPGNYPWRSEYYQMELDTYVPGDRIMASRSAHSLYFTLLPEFGLAGTIPFVLILVGMFRRLTRFQNGGSSVSGKHPVEKDLMLAKSIRASLIGYLCAGAFISVLYYPQFWYSIGLVIGLCGHSLARAKENRIAPRKN